MVEKKPKIKKTEIIFSEENGLIIEKLLEKYELNKVQEEGIKKFLESKISKERGEIFENLPGTKISKLVREVAERRITSGDLSLQLQQQLSLAKETAKNLATELEREVISQAKEVPVEEETTIPEIKIIPKTKLTKTTSGKEPKPEVPMSPGKVEETTPPEEPEIPPATETPEAPIPPEEKQAPQKTGEDVYREPIE